MIIPYRHNGGIEHRAEGMRRYVTMVKRPYMYIYIDTGNVWSSPYYAVHIVHTFSVHVHDDTLHSPSYTVFIHYEPRY